MPVLHQTGQRRKNAYRRIDRLAVKLSVKYDLSLGDISRKVGDGMGDIIVRHGQDGDLGNRSCSAPDDSRALIKSSELTVQISGISFTGGDFSLRGGNLTHGLAEGGDIRQNDQDVHAFFKSQILRSGKGDLRRQKTFTTGSLARFQEHYHMVGGAALLEGTAEKLRHIVFDAHRREHDGEILIGITAEGSLLYDLRGKLVVGQTVSGKDRQLLAADRVVSPSIAEIPVLI